MSVPDVEDVADATPAGRGDVRKGLRQVLITGGAITVPFFVTLIVLAFALNVISSALNPLIGGLEWFGVYPSVISEIAVKVGAVVVLVAFVFLVGLIAETREEGRVADTVETLVEAIPGVGSIYTSFDRMSEVLLESDTDSFQEVKLVEFPHDEVYTLGFLTASTAPEVEAAAGHEEMLTLFLPLAPNPVMGGFLVNVPAARVHDVDLTVEEGIQAVVTTGMAVGEAATEGLSADRLADLSAAVAADRPAGTADRAADGRGSTGTRPAADADRPTGGRASTDDPPTGRVDERSPDESESVNGPAADDSNEAE